MSAHVLPKSTYYLIFFSLMVLTAITVAVAFVNLGSLNFPIAIAVAITKATLVVLFFMHVKYSSRLIQLMVAAAFLWLALLIGGALSDYVSRGRVNHAAEKRSPTGAQLEDR